MLSVSNLSIKFGDSLALQNLSFSLKKGESLGFVGESGSGKSITALALMGLLPKNAKLVSGEASLQIPDSGETFNLLEIDEKTHRTFRGNHLSMVFQEPMTSLNPSMRCGKQVCESIILHQGVTKEKAREACLKLFGEMQLPNPEKVFRSYPHELSGGQKQRVMIAMALAGNPSILIADEPTTALDVTVQKGIILLLKKLVANRGLSLIFISHDLGVISQVTNRIIVLKEGQLVEEGTCDSIFNSPKHPYTKGLLMCKPPLNVRPQKLTTVSDFIETSDQHLEVEVISTEQRTEQNGRIYSASPILEVKDVVVEYTLKRNLVGKPSKSFRAVNKVNLNLYQGETLGLVGESGCGKSSLGRAIIGLTQTENGTISYLKKEVGRMKSHELASFRKQVQLIFQDPYSSLNPRHTIGEAIMEPIKFHKLAKTESEVKQKAISLIEQVSLPTDSFYRYPHEFSGGQRQRVAIARALALNPKVIICDEMVSALDVSVQAQILNLLNQLKHDLGLTYIFISHDLSVVKYMSNRVLIMKSGELVESGDPDEIFQNPQTEYTKNLIDSIPQIRKT
ncbi:MAG TPA: ABC transporter ATP-binding protein [Tenuifilaceae bacterium]|nr:ABC transporter ATP-binding protein [Tenuifilaceae bacterium]